MQGTVYVYFFDETILLTAYRTSYIPTYTKNTRVLCIYSIEDLPYITTHSIDMEAELLSQKNSIFFNPRLPAEASKCFNELPAKRAFIKVPLVRV